MLVKNTQWSDNDGDVDDTEEEETLKNLKNKHNKM